MITKSAYRIIEDAVAPQLLCQYGKYMDALSFACERRGMVKEGSFGYISPIFNGLQNAFTKYRLKKGRSVADDMILSAMGRTRNVPIIDNALVRSAKASVDAVGQYWSPGLRTVNDALREVSPILKDASKEEVAALRRVLKGEVSQVMGSPSGRKALDSLAAKLEETGQLGQLSKVLGLGDDGLNTFRSMVHNFDGASKRQKQRMMSIARTADRSIQKNVGRTGKDIAKNISTKNIADAVKSSHPTSSMEKRVGDFTRGLGETAEYGLDLAKDTATAISTGGVSSPAAAVQIPMDIADTANGVLRMIRAAGLEDTRLGKKVSERVNREAARAYRASDNMLSKLRNKSGRSENKVIEGLGTGTDIAADSVNKYMKMNDARAGKALADGLASGMRGMSKSKVDTLINDIVSSEYMPSVGRALVDVSSPQVGRALESIGTDIGRKIRAEGLVGI